MGDVSIDQTIKWAAEVLANKKANDDVDTGYLTPILTALRTVSSRVEDLNMRVDELQRLADQHGWNTMRVKPPPYSGGPRMRPLAELRRGLR